MNYDAKPYVSVLSPPGQYKAHIPSPNAANLPTSYHLFPVKCSSQGMIQTSPSNQYQQIFYSTPPPPPAPWVCNFHPSPAPTVAAIPFVDGQARIPGFGNSSPPPRFHLPLLQKNRKTEFQPGSRHTPKAQNLETDFKLAALRNGIRVEESPKTGKAAVTSSTTRICAGVDEEGSVGEALTLERNFGHAQLNSDGVCAENKGKRLDSAATVSFNSKSPEAKKCDSKVAPSLATNTDAATEEQGNAVEKSNSVGPPNEDLVEEFVINVILCAVNSLVQESEPGIKKHLSQEDLTENGDVQEDEKFVSKATDLLMDSKVENDGITSELRSVVEAAKVGEKFSPTSDPKESVMPKQAESLPNPNEAISDPKEPMPNPNEAISDPKEPLPNPAEVMNPAKAISDPKVLMRNQDETVPISTEKVPILSEPMAHVDEEISVKDVSSSAEGNAKSPEDQDVEDLFIQLALKKGIKVGQISPASSDVELDSAPESSGKENNRCQNDKETEDLFVRRALQKGIKVGRLSPTNTARNMKPGSLPESSLKEKEKSRKDRDIEELFVTLALKKGIKVGNVSPVNETSNQHNVKDMKIGEEFEKRAFRNGIRLGSSHMGPSNGNTSPTSVDVIPEGLAGDWLHSVTTPMAPLPPSKGILETTVVPHFARYMPLNTLVKFDTEGQGTLDWTTNNEPGYRKTTPLRQDSFEELAKRNGIRVGETLKRKVDSQTQTENSFKSQETQTVGLVGNASVQVDVRKEAFKVEFDEWMQEELSLIDPKASSFRELFLQEEESRIEAERRLAVEMDENVKAQRNTKILIDELKEQLANKEETIEKLNKDLKSLKKQKDNEIKRLTKEIKQKDEDLKTVTLENSMKEVVIENMREIAKEQNELVEKMEERLKAMEREMENERKKSESLFKNESSKDTINQTQGTGEWQVVKGRHSGTKATMNPKPSHPYHHLDGLSGFDDKEYEKYQSRRPTSVAQGIPSEEIQPRESLTSKNEGCVPTRTQDVALHRDNGMTTMSGDSVPRRPREPTIASGCTLGPSLPSSGIYMPRLPKELCPVSDDCTSSTSSTNSVGTFNSGNVSNSNGSHISPDAHGAAARVPYPTPGGTDITSLLPPGVPHQVLPNGLYGVPTVSDATIPTSVVTNQDLLRAPFPTPVSAANASLLPLGVPHQAIPGGSYSIPINASETNQDLTRIPSPSPPRSCNTPLLPPGITVDPALRQAKPVASSKSKTSNKFSSFDKLMEALRDSFPDHSRPSLMVHLKKAKEAFGTNGFKGKQISEIVDKVAQVIDQE